MKTIGKIFFIVFFSFTIRVFSQGNNLEFNDVKYITVSVTQTSSTVNDTNSIIITVPANKVWKIENCGITKTPTTNSYYYPDIGEPGGVLKINQNIIFSYSNWDSNRLSGPIWLPSGNYILKISPRQSGNLATVGDVFFGFISAIEFNIVP